MMYLVGKIVGTHGIKGELKVLNDSNFDRLKVGEKLFVNRNNTYEKIEITSMRTHKNFFLITINNINDINDVLSYVNLNIYTDKHETLEDGRYYYDDLIDCVCFDMNGKRIGVVSDITELPRGILLEIIKDNKTKALVPFVEAFIKEVDIENKKISIEPIEGLL